MVQIIPSEFFVGPPEIKAIKEVKGPERMRPASPAADHAEEHQVAEQAESLSAGNKHRQQASMKKERRTYCRRIYHWPVLEELRSTLERRHHDEEGWASPVTHIDEEV